MNDQPSKAPTKLKRTLSAMIAAMVFVLVVAAGWVWFPRSPRAVIHAGPTAQFGGFSPDGNSLITFDSHFIRIWNAGNGSLTRTIEAQDQIWQLPLQFSPDGKQFSLGHRTTNAKRLP